MTKTPLAIALSMACTCTSLSAHADATAAAANDATSEKTLGTVTVEAQSAASTSVNNGYQGLSSRVGKSNQALIDIPLSVTVITKDLIQDRAADNLVDALRNVAGVTFNAGEGGRIGDNIVIRGYNAANDLFLDNFRDNAQYNRDTFNDEQIDVLRGSASMLFGRGSTGGVINRVSKQPQLRDANELSVTVGTDDYKRTLADINKQTSDTSALRLNLMVHDAGSTRGVDSKRIGVAPSFSWGIGERDEFNVSYVHLEYDNTPDFGIPWINNRPAEVPITRQYGALNGSFQNDAADISTAKWIRRVNPQTTLTTAVRYSDVTRSLRGNTIRFANEADNTAVTRGLQSRGGHDISLAVQSDLNTTVQIAGYKNELLTGVEYSKEDINRYNLTDSCTTAQRNTVLADPANTVGSPNPGTNIPACYNDVSRTGMQNFDGRNVGLYAQDTFHLNEQWQLLAGLRHDRFSVDNPDDAAASIRFGVTSYRTGLIYKPQVNHSYYGAYGTSFNPSTENYTIGSNAGIPPEKNRNIEIGAKWDLAGGNLSLRTAVFRTEKTNERNTDLSSSTTVLSGKRHTDGIEIEAAGRITKAWEVFASAAHFNARIDEAAPGSNLSQDVGKRPGNTPKYAYSLWSTYQVLPQLKVGGGFEAVSDKTPQENYVNVAPAYVRWDATLQYDINKAYTVRLNGFNLTNEKIYSGLYRGFVVPANGRQVLATLSVKF